MTTTVTQTTEDRLTRKYTAFDSFQDMLDAKGGYRPSIQTRKGPDHTWLADRYDTEQEKRGDNRRAFRN